MLVSEFLGDQGYAHRSSVTGAEVYAPTPVSSQLDLVPNPELSSRFDGLSEAEIELAQLAYNVFHRPFALDADDRNQGEVQQPPTDARVKMFTVSGVVGEIGVAQVEKGFRLFRRILGESSYGGLNLAISEDTERTKLRPYFRLANNRRIVINEWNDHDKRLHLMGCLLAHKEVTRHIAAAGGVGLDSKDEDEQIKIGDAIDFALSDMQSMWSHPASSNGADRLSGRIALIQALPDIMSEDFSALTPEQVVNVQTELIKGWQREKLFVVPDSAKKAATHVIFG